MRPERVVPLVVMCGVLFCLPAAAVPEATPGGLWETVFWAPPVPPRAHYTIDCRIEAQKVTGTETIRFTNEATRPMARLALSWGPKFCGLPAVSVGGQQIDPLGPAQSRGDVSYVVFELPRPLEPGQSLDIDVSFGADFPLDRFFDLFDAIWIADWHPRLYWTFPTQDDFAVKVDLPADWAFIASGRLNPQTGRYEAKAMRSFGLVVGKGLHVKEALSGDVLVRCLHTEQAAECADLLVETAVDVIDFYRERFGFYPHETLSIFPGRGSPGDGWPLATAVVGIHGQQQFDEDLRSTFQWITAHEIGHQYWSEHVMARDIPTWLGRHHLGPLMIGLGFYADRAYTRARGLENDHAESFDRLAGALRDDRDLTVALPAEQLEKIAQSGRNFSFWNSTTVHAKGYAIISALETLLGEDVFGRVYRGCLDRYAGRRMGMYDFQRECENQSGQDLSWFFDQWVHSNRYPAYEITAQECSEQGEGHLTRVEIARLGTLITPVTVMAEFEDGRRQMKCTDRLLAQNTLVFESRAPLTEVRLDPEGELALVAHPLPVPKVSTLVQIRELTWTGGGNRAKDVFDGMEDPEALSTHDWFKLGLCLYDGRHYQESLAVLERLTSDSEASDVYRFAAYVWQGHLLDLLDRRDEALSAYRQALERADEHTMQHDQYDMRIDHQWVEERIETPFVRE